MKITECPREQGEEMQKYLSRRMVFAVSDQMNHIQEYQISQEDMKKFLHDEIDNLFEEFRPDVESEDYD